MESEIPRVAHDGTKSHWYAMTSCHIKQCRGRFNHHIRARKPRTRSDTRAVTILWPRTTNAYCRPLTNGTGDCAMERLWKADQNWNIDVAMSLAVYPMACASSAETGKCKKCPSSVFRSTGRIRPVHTENDNPSSNRVTPTSLSRGPEPSRSQRNSRNHSENSCAHSAPNKNLEATEGGICTVSYCTGATGSHVESVCWSYKWRLKVATACQRRVINRSRPINQRTSLMQGQMQVINLANSV